MAMAIETRPALEQQVLTAIGRSYVTTHQPVVETRVSAVVIDPEPAVGELPAVIVASRSTIEVVLGEEPVTPGLVAAVAELAGGGWEVVVLIQGHRSGDAHAGLRGTPCVLQQWWHESGRIFFGGFETP